MDNISTSEIDELALKIERLIAQNEEVLKKYEENQASSSVEDTSTVGGDVDAKELFS